MGDAVERLARRLHATMERFDPTGDVGWDQMEPYRKEFFRACIRELILERDLVLEAVLSSCPPRQSTQGSRGGQTGGCGH